MKINLSLNSKSSIIYIYDKQKSFMFKVIQFYFQIKNTRNRIEKKIKNSQYNTDSVPIPHFFFDKYYIEEKVLNNKNFWIINPGSVKPQKVIFYYHGGAYIANLNTQHWKLIDKIIEKTKATFIIPNYPLVPGSNYLDIYDFINSIYISLLDKYVGREIIFIGVSAGGGLALGHAMNLRDHEISGPSQVILLSPWLDITMSNPEILSLEKSDKILDLKGTIMAGELYAKDISKKDYRVSPIYGDFKDLGKISIFTGTHDLLFADCEKLHVQLNKENIIHNYFEYPKMFHA